MPIRSRKQRQALAPEPKSWLVQKLDQITSEFQEGYGYGEIYESQFLCYLECLMVMEKYSPATMWDSWKARIKSKMPDPTKELVPMNRLFPSDDRDSLIRELQSFQIKMLPTRVSIGAAPDKEEEPGTSILDMFQEALESEET